MHAVIEALGVGPVEMFASSGGAVTALALVAAHPNDLTTLAAHEPPLISVLPDAEAAERAAPAFGTRTKPRGRVPARRPSSACLDDAELVAFGIGHHHVVDLAAVLVQVLYGAAGRDEPVDHSLYPAPA